MAEWLFSSGQHVYAGGFEERERLSFRRGQSKAYVEEISLMPGLWMYRGEATPNCAFNVEVDGGEPTQGRLILGAILASNGTASLEGRGEEIWRDDGRAYVMTPVERRARYEVDATKGWRTVSLRLEAEALELVAGESGLPELFTDALDKGRNDVLEMMPLPGALRLVAQDLLRPAFRGPMGKIYRQAKALEFLAHQFTVLERSVQPDDPLPSRDIAKVRMARDRLLADLRDPPDLDTLSRLVGLSPKRLNRGFRELYGSTVFVYLRDARLEVARKALEEGTPLPLKQLSWELGYGQVSNFVTAFRRRYGITPGAIRREEELDD